MNIALLVSKAKTTTPLLNEDFYTLTTSQMQQFVLLVIDEFTQQSKALSTLERDD